MPATNPLKPKIVELRKGDYLFQEGTEATFAYVLVEGSIEIVRKSAEGEQTLGRVEKGSIFGEMAIIDGSPRSASARAEGKCKVQEVDKKAFLKFLSNKPEAALNMMVRLSGYVRAADKRVAGSMLDMSNGSEQTAVPAPVDTKEIKDVHHLEDTESIYSSPPSRPVLITAVSILTFILVMAVWGSFTFVDKTVSTRGKFTNTAPNIEIQSSSSSVIKEMYLERGKFVNKGDIIAVLDGTVVNANLKIVQDKINILKNKILRIKLQKEAITIGALKGENNTILSRVNELDSINREILSKHFDEFILKMNLFSADLSRLDNEISSLIKDHKLIRDQLNIKIQIEEGKRKLYSNNVGSLMEVLNSTDQRISVNRQLRSTSSNIEKLKSAKNSIIAGRKTYLAEQYAGIAEDLSAHMDQLLQLEEELTKNQLEKNNLSVKSPVDGVVLNMPTMTAGSIVNKGEPIVTLVRSGLPLVLEIDIDPKDVSDLFYGDPVSVKLDALPFQQFGDLSGTLIFISDDTVPASLQGEPGAYYRGRVNIEQSEMLKLPEDFDLTAGMLASADLKVGKRRLITYFTHPIIKSLSSAMREPD